MMIQIKYKKEIFIFSIFIIIILLFYFINDVSLTHLYAQSTSKDDNFYFYTENFNNQYKLKYNIHSFFILLPNHTERKKNVDINIKKIKNINYNIFDAVIGNTLNMIEFKKKQKENDNLWLIDNKKRKNQLGCYLSHRNIIEKIKDDKNYLNKYDYTIIFEDDLKIINTNLYNEIEKILDDLKSVKKDDFDIIFLGNLKNNHGKKIINNIYELDKNNDLWGTQAYLINHKSLSKIYQSLLKIDKPIDVKYQDLIKDNSIKAFVIYPILVSQSGSDSTINIYNKKFNKKFLSSINN